MNKFLRSSGIVFSMLLLVSVSATAQVKKKAVVRKTTTAQTVKVADLSCFDLKGKVHTCIVWSNAGGEKSKRIFDANGKWVGYRDDAGWNLWKNISGLRRDAKGRIVFYREKGENGVVPRAITYDTAGRVAKITSEHDEETDYTLYYYNSKGLLVKAVEKAVDMSEENTTVYKYGNYELDSHGNWTSRSCEFEIEGNSIFESQTRHITYYK